MEYSLPAYIEPESDWRSPNQLCEASMELSFWTRQFGP